MVFVFRLDCNSVRCDSIESLQFFSFDTRGNSRSACVNNRRFSQLTDKPPLDVCVVWQGKRCKSSPTLGFRILNRCSFVHGIRMFRCVVHVLAPDATIYNATATGLKRKRYSLIVMLILSKLCNVFMARCD